GSSGGDEEPSVLAEEKFQKTLDVALVDRDVPAFMRQDLGAVDADRPALALECECERGGSGSFRRCVEDAIPECSRGEIRIECRAELRGDGEHREAGFYHPATVPPLTMHALKAQMLADSITVLA